MLILWNGCGSILAMPSTALNQDDSFRPLSITPYPRGWYLVAYSDEIATGAVRALKLFGRDLALFRDIEGRPHLVDAYCPHLGADLGRGTVHGDCIRCPFHGWEFRGETGECVRLANGDSVPPKARLRRWPLCEQSGMVLAWFHEQQEQPEWEVGEFPELTDAGWSRFHHSEWRLAARIQDISENDADVSHSPILHTLFDKTPVVEMETSGARCHWLMQARLKLAALGVPQLPGVGPLRRIPDHLPTQISVTRWGLSLGWIRQSLELPQGLSFRTQTLATTTPIDANHVRLTLRHRVRATPIRALTELFLRSYSRMFNLTVEEDIKIWEHKIYRMQPIASKSDWAILRFRKWARQFYDPAEYERALHQAPL